jgi:hypothetical protein
MVSMIKSIWLGCKSIWQGLVASLDVVAFLVARYVFMSMLFAGFVMLISLRLESP